MKTIHGSNTRIKQSLGWQFGVCLIIITWSILIVIFGKSGSNQSVFDDWLEAKYNKESKAASE